MAYIPHYHISYGNAQVWDKKLEAIGITLTIKQGQKAGLFKPFALHSSPLFFFIIFPFKLFPGLAKLMVHECFL